MGRVAEPADGAGSAPNRAAIPVGASGHLFEIPDAPAGRSLVIKIFPWANGLPAEVVRNFTQEGAKVADLHHPHLVPVVDAGCLGDGTPFVVIDRLRGQTLEERMAQRGTPPLADAVAILRAAAAALSVAHALGVVHREVRADNVFIEETPGHPGGFPRLLDFGVARLAAAARVAGRVVREASADEVAPELRGDRSAAGDHRADQFALAALAHRLLRGATAPYGQPGGPAFQRLWDHGTGAPRAGAAAAGAPAVDAVLARAMSWRPEARYPSVAAFWYAVEEALGAPRAVAAARAPVLAPQPAVAVAPSPAIPAAPAALPAAPAPRLPPLVAARLKAPPSAAPPMSLTQQFFAEGDRLEAASLQPSHDPSADSATAAPAPRAPAPARQTSPSAVHLVRRREPLATSGTFERVPRRRAPLIAAAFLALAALAIIARAALWGHLMH